MPRPGWVLCALSPERGYSSWPLRSSHWLQTKHCRCITNKICCASGLPLLAKAAWPPRNAFWPFIIAKPRRSMHQGFHLPAFTNPRPQRRGEVPRSFVPGNCLLVFRLSGEEHNRRCLRPVLRGNCPVSEALSSTSYSVSLDSSKRDCMASRTPRRIPHRRQATEILGLLCRIGCKLQKRPGVSENRRRI